MTPPEDARHTNLEEGATLVLNASALGSQAVAQNLARLLWDASRTTAGRDEDDVRRAVEDAVHRSGLDIPRVQVDRFVEQMVRGGGLARITDDAGRALYGD